ncbi:lysylphosphatidylglycerol synthase transmembrane domain-containing protein [Methanocella sp. MCL-LM]|uniref:lysylphosphatidylglycerol synthase transmembrane domain-containing protein n=1 Tax=Methanocella sp. MCL-LM TaxID=3412035 RepID=UPI003C74577A
MDKEKIVKATFILITLLIAYFLLSQISLPMIAATLLSISMPSLLASFALYVLMNLFRAFRYSVMTDRNLYSNNWKMFTIVCTHNIANNVLPFRTGELTFVYLAKVQLKIATAIGAVTLLLSRVYDIFIICILVLLVLLIFPGNYGLINGIVPYIVLVAFGLFIFITLFIAYQKLFIAVLNTAYRWFKNGMLIRIINRLEETTQFYSNQTFQTSIGLPLILTVIIWVLNVLSIYVLVVGIGITISPWAIFIGIMLVVIAASIPVPGIANFGSFELIWAFVFSALSVTRETAISSGFAVHLIALTYAIALWLSTTALDRALH